MEELVATEGAEGTCLLFRCSACKRVFTPPPAPRGARLWSADEARVRVTAEFIEHVQGRHAGEKPLPTLESIGNLKLATDSRAQPSPLLSPQG